MVVSGLSRDKGSAAGACVCTSAPSDNRTSLVVCLDVDDDDVDDSTIRLSIPHPLLLLL